MTHNHERQLEGLTLNIYIYVAKSRTPLGPRDVMRGLNLSSPSVAHRHLQNLEAAGLLKRNEYGEYQLKEKAKVPDFLWAGKRLLPRTLIFSIGFLALLITEAAVLAWHWRFENYTIKVYYAVGMGITGAAMAFFLLEAMVRLRRLRLKKSESEMPSS